MKIKIRIIVILLVLFFSLTILFNKTSVFGHNEVLDVEYDLCDSSYLYDNDDEIWYYLSLYTTGEINDEDYDFNYYYHIGNNIQTISYYINNTSKDNQNYQWTTDLSADDASLVIESYVHSMLKWNNVYFYTYGLNGIPIPHKIVNIVETDTITDANIIIYPITRESYVAMTQGVDGFSTIEYSLNDYHDSSNMIHAHISKWEMHINIDEYNPSKTDYELLSEFTGEHEMGHVLGLRDVDNLCTADSYPHHSEILMGYGIDGSIHVPNVTYKDIAGVAVTRGFHTDGDHVWMRRIDANDGHIDMICAICNGVRNNVTLDPGGETYEEKPFVDYQDCNHHDHTNSNMLLVASDGNRKFLKCMYCRHIVTIENTFNVNDYSADIHFSDTMRILNPVSKFYEINVQSNKYYEFVIDSTNSINVKLYDEDFNLLSISDINSSNSIAHIIKNLSIGKYYLEIQNVSYDDINISLNIVSNNSLNLSNNLSNNILINFYNGVYEYSFNAQTPGFYKFTLDGTVSSGSISYPTSAISLYNDSLRTETLDRFDISNYNYQSFTNANENSMWVYLPRNGYFYIDIILPNIGYTSLTLTISEPTTKELDIFNLQNVMSFESTNLLTNASDKSDYVKVIDNKQTGSFYLTLSYSGLQTDPVDVFLIEKDTLDSIYLTTVSTNNTSRSTWIELDEGEYYLGYFNLKSGAINLSIQRFVDDSVNEVYGTLITDPDSGTPCGSQINVYEFNNNSKSYRQNNIKIGFTRLIYLDSSSNYSLSRLDYYWYSSDEFVATVSQYGTVFGKSAGSVTILAVLKSDPSIIFVKEFIIEEDNSSGDIIVNNNLTIKYSDTNNGLFHLHLENVNIPYPMYTYYIWNTTNISNGLIVTNDNWGNYTVNTYGTFALVATQYIYNNRVTVYINITITNN